MAENLTSSPNPSVILQRAFYLASLLSRKQGLTSPPCLHYIIWKWSQSWNVRTSKCLQVEMSLILMHRMWQAEAINWRKKYFYYFLFLLFFSKYLFCFDGIAEKWEGSDILLKSRTITISNSISPSPSLSVSLSLSLLIITEPSD